ncbi:unnamed protein product [Prorocentrum cordatum]|uniref:Uncharacterized protein n=1 Tax=Prorocentrum cordatum TaxID=2364126 RepID=A0ABN9V501_9DINO|nr:unnamed protein product [Polarella glacialis]
MESGASRGPDLQRPHKHASRVRGPTFCTRGVRPNAAASSDAAQGWLWPRRPALLGADDCAGATELRPARGALREALWQTAGVPSPALPKSRRLPHGR